MPLVDDDQVVEAFPPDRADHPFNEGVLTRLGCARFGTEGGNNEALWNRDCPFEFALDFRFQRAPGGYL